MNEEEDPFMVIQRLRLQVSDLQAELRWPFQQPAQQSVSVTCGLAVLSSGQLLLGLIAAVNVTAL